MSFKLGDLVYFNKSKDGCDFSVGVLISQKDDNFLVLDYGRSYSKVTHWTKNIYYLDDRSVIVDTSKNYYSKQIEELKSQLKPISRSFYSEELSEDYKNIREQIINTCLNMSHDLDDTEFENKLKAICIKKTNLFERKCTKVDEARKHNGEVKYRIRELENSLKRQLETLDNGIKNFENTMNII